MNRKIFTIVLAGMLAVPASAWKVKFDDKVMAPALTHKGLTLGGVSVKAVDENGDTLRSSDYASVKKINGNGSVTFVYTSPGKPTLRQSFYINDKKDYLLTEAWLEDDGGTATRRFTAFECANATVLPSGGENRNMTVPFDNDKFRGYEAFAWNDNLTATSYVA